MSVETLRALLALRMPDYHLVNAEPLSGGLSNRCWQVSLEHNQTGRRYSLVWRPHSASSSAFGVSRQHEHEILNLIPASLQPSLAPRTFALLPEGLLVEWVEGETAQPSFCCESLMALLAQIHQLPTPSWRLDCRSRAAHYWLSLGGMVDEPKLRKIHTHFQSVPAKTWFADTCCHHDLGWYNVIIGSGGEHRVIDWEYAAAGDPSLDLALTVAANQLELSEAVHLYCQYRGIFDPAVQSRWLEAVSYWQPWCDYLALLWFYVGAQLFSADEQPEQGYLAEAYRLQEKLWNWLQFSD